MEFLPVLAGLAIALMLIGKDRTAASGYVGIALFFLMAVIAAFVI